MDREHERPSIHDRSAGHPADGTVPRLLFEQAGGVKRTGGGDDGFSDMGSEDDEKAAAKSKKKPLTKKSKKSHDSGEKDDTVRAEDLSYKVCQSQSLRAVRIY